MISPFAFPAGAGIQLSGRYHWASVLSWSLSLLGSGLLSTLDVRRSTGQWVGYQLVASAGTGLQHPNVQTFATGNIWTVLRDGLPDARVRGGAARVAHGDRAFAFSSFAGTFTQTWGITIGSAILQNRLDRTLPAQFDGLFPAGVKIAYAAIPVIGSLEEPLRGEVRAAFAACLKVVWHIFLDDNMLYYEAPCLYLPGPTAGLAHFACMATVTLSVMVATCAATL